MTAFISAVVAISTAATVYSQRKSAKEASKRADAGCSFLSHLVVLQYFQSSTAGGGCCSFLSHLVVLQFTVS